MSRLRVVGLAKRHGRAPVLKGVTFEAAASTVVGLVGPNGSGKSTLLRLLATVLRPSAGSIYLDDLDVLRRPYAARAHIGWVPDVFSLPPDVKVWEFLELFARCHGLRGRLRQSTIAEFLRLVDLFDFRFAFCASLSRGMQQKLMLARALLHDPDLVLLDEPLAALDPQSRLEMLEVLRELGNLGKTIVISSSAVGELVDVCDRVGLLAAGELTLYGSVPELIQQLELRKHISLLVLDEPRGAERLLRGMDAVSDLALAGHTLSFTCAGGSEAVADLLRQLIEAGVRVVQCSSSGQPVAASVATAARTSPSIEQLRP
ncbi:MAG: ABC transporter ATP-binding protein [Chloroflexota bacterium]